MSCFPCFSSKGKKGSDKNDSSSSSSSSSSGHHTTPPPPKPIATKEANKPKPGEEMKDKTPESEIIDAQNFNFRELATATKNFRQECLLGEGGFGKVFKATLQPSGQVMAVKQLDRNGLQGNKEFLGEVKSLSLLKHPNLVKLNGYCADGDQRILVYEYMSGGSLEDCLFAVKEDRKPMDWFARIKIASEVAKGLEYLHDQVDPPIIFRDLKSSNILLDENLNPKLSDFGLANLGPSGGGGDKSPLPSRVMGTYGYSAPEYTRGDPLTAKSDIYSFGVVMLELITGRKAIDTTKPNNEQNLVTWVERLVPRDSLIGRDLETGVSKAQPYFRDPKKFPDLADPLLGRLFPERDLNQAVAVAAMCLQEEAEVRPLITDVMAALSFLSTVPDENLRPVPYPPEPKPEPKKKDQSKDSSSDSSDNEEKGTNSSNQKPKKKKNNKKLEKKRVSFQDDVPASSDGSSSSGSSEEEESSFKLEIELSAADVNSGDEHSGESESEDEVFAIHHDGGDAHGEDDGENW